MGVVAQFEAVGLSNGVLEVFDFFVVKLDHLAAFGTDNMVVMLTWLEDFEHRPSVIKLLLLDEVRILEQVEGSVDGGKADVMSSTLDLFVQLLSADVVVHAKEYLNDAFALLGLLELLRQ